MALIKCPDCGKEMSSTTPTCPHCGYQPRPSYTRLAGFLALAFILLAAILARCGPIL